MEEQLQLKAHWFFSNKDIQSLLLRTNPQIEQLHYALLQAARQLSPVKLEMDSIVMEIMEEILSLFTNYEMPRVIPARLKKHHLVRIETAKQYLNENLARNISLQELAEHCCISPFHFSRIYKAFTGYAVYQYLQLMRLKHAEMLLATALPVADIAFQSGFNSIDYFSSAFKKQYKLSPSAFRVSRKKTAGFHK